jgi:hypothetical protein
MRLLFTGFALLVGGFVYAVMFVNIPYQDPPSELQARWDRDNALANMLMLAGLATALAGLVAIAWRRLGAK